MSTQVILGVDIGTTSVKVCLIDAHSREELASESKDTQSNIPATGAPHGVHEQNVRKIVSTLHNCILRLPKDLLKHVKHIGICGQMHGIVLWRSPAWTDKFELVNEHISNLVTWQDTRCDHAYLATLPRPDSHLRAYTGYGVNTLLWMTHHEPGILDQYAHAATIQDFIVAMLCDLEEPVMCNQNAASWGYFNCKLDAWNVDILRNHAPTFPLHLLPKIQPSGTSVGTLTRDWLGIPRGTPINVAMGDLQCSVLATLQYPTDAIVNISTSAQIAFIDESFQPEEHYKGADTRGKTEIGGNAEQTNTIESLGAIKKRISNLEVTEEAKNCDTTVEKNKSKSLGLLERLHNGPLRGLFNAQSTSESTQINSDDNEVVGYDEVDPIVPKKHSGEMSSPVERISTGEKQIDEKQSQNNTTSCLSSKLEAVCTSHIEHFPYFGSKYIAVGASMNGGNCLATFICTLQTWFKEFGFNVPQNQIWVKLINQSGSTNHITRYDSNLTIVPTLLGDRHVIEENASILNITAGNLNVNSIFVALCKGIIGNLHAIMNHTVLHASGITRIIGIGSCLSRNHILQYYVENVYGLKLVLENQSRDASYGAALSTIL